MTIKKIKSSDILGDNYYIYNLTSSNYTPNINGSITITCTVKNIYGDAIANKSVQLYQNDTAVGSATTTNNNGVATWTITCSTAGIQKFSVKDTVIEVFVDTTSKIGHNHTTSDITNFPEIPTKTSDLTNDSNFLTSHQSLANYIQKSNTNGLIKNDGTIDTNTYLTTHQDISNKVNTSDLGETAFSNDYNDLDNLPTIPTAYTHPSTHPATMITGLSTVATSGSYNDLSNKPSIPTKTSDLTNDSGYLTSHQDISGKANVSDLGDVAFSNDYADLDNIPSTFSPSTHTHDDRYYTETEIDTALNGKQATLVSGTNIKTINSQSLLGTGDITVGDDVGSFTDLQALINNASSGDIIILDKDYQYNNDNDSANLAINKSLTIHGNGHIIDADSKVPILVLNGSNITVTINETTFINGRASGSIAGGAISGSSLSGDSILSLNHCIFIKNQSITTIGGALAINKNAVINHCIFIENTCKRYGGAIYCNDNTSIIKNCIFKDNIAQSNGNDICCNRNDLIIYNCDTSSANLYHTTNKPYLTDHQDITGKANTTDLGETAFSNDYNDLDNLPTIPAAYTHPSTHPSSMITDSNTHSNIGNTANTLENIITNIDTKLGSLANVDLIEVTSSLGTASANTMNKLYLVAETTGATNDNYEVFVTVRTGTSGNYSYSWEKVDTARIDLSDYLTTANAQQTYVAKESGKGLSSNDYTTSEKNKLAGLHTVATSGSYNDLTNKPTIPTVPTNVSAFTNDSGYLTGHQDISGKEDKSNKVTSWNSTTTDTNYPSEKLVKNSLDGKANSTHTHSDYASSTHNHGNISNNGFISSKDSAINKNVVTDSTGKITVEDKPSIPSKTSDLTNDSNFISTSSTNGLIKNDGTIDINTYLTTSVASSTYVAKESGKGLFSGNYNDLTNKPSYTPTVTSSTTNSMKIGSINISGSEVDIYATDTVYTHPNDLGSTKTSGLYKIALNDKGHVTSATSIEKSDITGLGIPASDTTYSLADGTNNGLSSNDFTSAEKTKLSGIATGANNYTHPASHGNITSDGKCSTIGTVDVSRGDLLLFADATSSQYTVKGSSFIDALNDLILDLIDEGDS